MEQLLLEFVVVWQLWIRPIQNATEIWRFVAGKIIRFSITGGPLLTLFFETLEKQPCKEKTVFLFFRHPDWKDVPAENPIIIKKPPVKCPRRNTNLQNGTCLYRNVMYQDLDGMPSSDCCNSCFCDFGERHSIHVWQLDLSYPQIRRQMSLGTYL